MATEFEDLSDEELEARQRAEDGESDDTNPVAAADDSTPGAATDDTVAGAEGNDTIAGATGNDVVEADTLTGATGNDKIEGVQSKDGSRVLPYGALQAARRDARRAESRAERAERERDEARQQLEDLKAGKTPIGDVTEEDVRDMEENFPEQGAKLRRLFEQAQAAAPSKTAAPAADEPGDDPVQEAIDQVPLLLEWQHGNAELFTRAQEIDAVLVKSPKWAGKPAVERFQQVASMVAEENDIPLPKKASSPAAPAANTPAPQPARKAPETLSDFKGGSIADHGSIDVARASPQALLNKMASMSDEEIDAHLLRYGG